MKTDELLSARDLTKDYSVTVLDRARLDVRKGEIHALLGANGAGKSTMCRIIAGLVPATSGTMHLNGQPYAPESKLDAEHRGVQIVQQELNQIATLSVAENLLLGRFPTRFGIIDRGELHRRATFALKRFGLHIDASTLTGTLGVGQQQMIEIATALDRECRLLILDEPTAALSAGESQKLFELLDQLRDQGVGIIYVSHRLDEVSRIADRFTVLRDGKFIGTYPTGDYTHHEMVDLMTGESGGVNRLGVHQCHAKPQPAIRVCGISRGRFVQDVSFDVCRGQRLGIAGLVGSGRTELVRLIFGADPADAGEIYLGDDSRPRRFRSPSEAVTAGLAMVTEDRKQNGLLLSQSIRVNTTVASMVKRFSVAGLIRGRAEREATETMRATMGTRCNGIEQNVDTLSGGNQQKVAVAKWLLRDADIFFFDEPTRGIDVATRRRIYRLIETLASEGKAIVIISSDLEELLETCDRIAVMSAGRMAGIFDRGDWSEQQIMQAAFSHGTKGAS